ncbi:hypothetical protein [Herbaspirillum sp. YR522]|uniref:hypothetical protein n=1 Tax=Herbaspirillum sp. YR522 TaxID=1144342 RepID=UPI00026FA296|nr:hypothetical protein [Herbaspirillum sp. YR522]EJN06456.1 hypothetical protein PMI40_02242 [Herbaspirillum sp. YR522]
MKPGNVITAAGFFLALGIVLLMTAADNSAQRQAELQQKRRLVNHFPDLAIAQMTVPAQHKQD